MYSFKIGVASHIIQIETIYDYSFYACRNFLVDGEADFVIHTTLSDIEKEREYRASDCLLKQTDDRRIEFVAVHRKICEKLIESNIIMIHGAAVSLENKAFLFCGRSGIGKTTHIYKWTDNYPNAHIINGDKPFVILKEKEETPLVCGSPWCGKERMAENTIVPLNAIAFLERSEENHICRMSFSEAFPYLYQQVFLPKRADKLSKTLNAMKLLAGNISFYHFYINNFKDDCIQVTYDALMRGIES